MGHAKARCVVVDRNAEKRFKRRALEHMPNEYMETLFGYVRRGLIVIEDFIPIEHIGTPRGLTYDSDDLDRHRKIAESRGLCLLGTIHTHPWRKEAFFSEGDAKDVILSGDQVFAICAIDTSSPRRRCVINYWPGIHALNVEYR